MKEERLQRIPPKYKGLLRNQYKELYAKKFENVGEMNTFVEKYNLPKLNEEAENLNRPITADKIEAVIKKLPTHKLSLIHI